MGSAGNELFVLAQATKIGWVASSNIGIGNARVGAICDEIRGQVRASRKRKKMRAWVHTRVLPSEEAGSGGGGDDASESNENGRETHDDGDVLGEELVV